MNFSTILTFLLVLHASTIGGECKAILSMLHRDFAGVQFTVQDIFPRTTIDVTLTDGLIVLSDSCRSQLALSAINGAGWTPQFLEASAITLTTSTVTINATIILQSNLSIPITAVDSFTEQGVYTFTLPWNCTNASLSSNTISFNITQGRRTTLGRLSTFIVLLSGGVGVGSALLGSPLPLIQTQLLSLVASPTCGPVDIQEEFEVIKYTLTPFDFRPLLGTLAFPREMRFVFASLFLLVVGILLETLRFIAENYLICTASSMEVDNFGLPLRSVNSGMSSITLGHLVNSSPTTSGVSGDETVSPPRRAQQPLVPAAGSIHDYRGAPIPPYLCYVLLLGLMMGSGHFAAWVGLNSKSNVLNSGVALLTLLLFGIGTVGLSMTITRDSTIFWCSYMSQRGSIPVILQPGGVWGPNNAREKSAPFLIPWTRGRKGMSPFVLLLCMIVAIISAVTPQSEGKCLLQFGLINFVLCCILLLFTLRPCRSIISNFAAFGGSASIFVASVFQSVSLQGPGTQAVDPVTAELISAAIAASICTFYGICEILIRFWELRRGNERRAAREGEKQRRQRLLQGGARSARAQRLLLKEVVDELIEETIINSQQTATESPEEALLAHDEKAKRRRARFRAASVWRQSHSDIVATDDAPPTLAQYLVQDFDRIPMETREDLLLADENDAKARQTNLYLQPLQQTSSSTSEPREFIIHKNPPCFQTVSIEFDKRAPSARPDFV